MSDKQGISELHTFRSFVECARLPVVLESIRKRDPPEPDIDCELSGHGRTSFELVEIVDSDFARLVSNQIRVQESLRRLSDVDRLANFSNALIYIRFVGSARVKQREREIAALFEFLRALPVGFDGDIKVPAELSLATTVRSVRVTRGDFSGPHFQVEAGSFISDPIIERMGGKFAKHYTTQHRLELLAFYELHPVRPPGMWLPTVQAYIEGNIYASQFSRVWVFDVGSKEVLFVSDADLAANGRAV